MNEGIIEKFFRETNFNDTCIHLKKIMVIVSSETIRNKNFMKKNKIIFLQ